MKQPNTDALVKEVQKYYWCPENVWGGNLSGGSILIIAGVFSKAEYQVLKTGKDEAFVNAIDQELFVWIDDKRVSMVTKASSMVTKASREKPTTICDLYLKHYTLQKLAHRIVLEAEKLFPITTF